MYYMSNDKKIVKTLNNNLLNAIFTFSSVFRDNNACLFDGNEFYCFCGYINHICYNVYIKSSCCQHFSCACFVC